jgi:AraC-like DNA-binding protein
MSTIIFAIAPAVPAGRARGIGAAMDVLSELLCSVRLTGGIFLDAQFTAPWCITANMSPECSKPFLPNPAQLVGFHVVIEGELLVIFGDEPPIKARAGEILLLPGNDGHVLSSAPGLKAVDPSDFVRPSTDGGPMRISHGGGGKPTHIICGFLGSEETYNPLIAALPRALKLDLREGLARDWIESSVLFAANELAAGRMASSGVLSRLSETLLVEAVRQYSSALADGSGSWLNGVKDPQIGRALALLHHKLDAQWSAESLAKEVAMSRSAFTDRFATLVGMPPIRYLTVWRMQTAKQRLREKRIPIAQLAHSVGYESEEAFSRAFKREYGEPPAQWRDQ